MRGGGHFHSLGTFGWASLVVEKKNGCENTTWKFERGLASDATASKDTVLAFSDVLQMDCAVTMQTKNLQIRMIKMYKTRNGLSLPP